MNIKQKIEFEQKVNRLRIQSLERMAVETDPHTSQFDEIIDEMRVLEDKQVQLCVQGLAENQKDIYAPGIIAEEHP